MSDSVLQRTYKAINRLEILARRTVRRILFRPGWPVQNLEDLLDPDGLTGDAEHDLLYLPALPMDFRWQRPQQLALALARGNSRVTYVEIFDRSLSQPVLRSRLYGSRLRRFRIRVPGRPNVFRTRISGLQADWICNRLSTFGADRVKSVLVQHPLWYPVCRRLAASGIPILYDRIDWHAGFDDAPPSIESDERRLIELASAVAYTAPLLKPSREREGQDFVHLPNAAESARFSVTAPPSRPVIGYVGAIDHWFDFELVEQLANRQPAWLFRFAGMCEQRRLVQRLTALPNVEFLGEVPYLRVPDFFAQSSLLLIPFRRGELVDRVDPVKMYEAWASGRPVVAPRMPSLTNWRKPLIYTYETQGEAEARIVEALAENSVEARQHLEETAADHSWGRRAAAIENMIDKMASGFGVAGRE